MRLALLCCLVFLTSCATVPPKSAEFAPAQRYYYDDINYLNYRQVGEGSKTLFLLHGYGSSGYNWDDLVPLLEIEDTRLLIFDMIGSGFSSRPRHHDYSIVANAQILSDFIQDYKITDYSLMGHSFGGGVSLVTAMLAQAEDRQMPDSLILLNSVSYKTPAPIFISAAKIPLLSQAAIKLLSPRLMTHISLSRVFFDDAKIRPDQRRRYSYFIEQDDFALAITQMARDVVPQDYEALTDAFALLNVPALVLWGAEDAVLPLANGVRLAAEMQDAELIQVPSCGHNAQEECPVPVADAANQFLGAL